MNSVKKRLFLLLVVFGFSVICNAAQESSALPEKSPDTKISITQQIKEKVCAFREVIKNNGGKVVAATLGCLLAVAWLMRGESGESEIVIESGRGDGGARRGEGIVQPSREELLDAARQGLGRMAARRRARGWVRIEVDLADIAGEAPEEKLRRETLVGMIVVRALENFREVNEVINDDDIVQEIVAVGADKGVVADAQRLFAAEIEKLRRQGFVWSAPVNENGRGRGQDQGEGRDGDIKEEVENRGDGEVVENQIMERWRNIKPALRGAQTRLWIDRMLTAYRVKEEPKKPGLAGALDELKRQLNQEAKLKEVLRLAREHDLLYIFNSK